MSRRGVPPGVTVIRRWTSCWSTRMHPNSLQSPESAVTPISIRDLHGLDDYRAVVELERAIWGYTDTGDVVTVPVFIITVKRGGILIGAFDDGEPDGRVCVFDRRHEGRRADAVVAHDGRGARAPSQRAGPALKLAQRERAIAAGFDLMEWTFDPLQALNAHLNFARLGVVCDEYVREPLRRIDQRAAPRDADRSLRRAWRLREPHVERRIAARGRLVGARERSG